VSISLKTRSAPGHRDEGLVVLVADDRDGQKNWFASRKNVINAPMAHVAVKHAPAAEHEQRRHEELAVELEQRREDRRGARERDVVARVVGEEAAEEPGVRSPGARSPASTRMPLTDSASVAVTRLKLSLARAGIETELHAEVPVDRPDHRRHRRAR